MLKTGFILIDIYTY